MLSVFIDRGGTFTDCFGVFEDPDNSKRTYVAKLLSVDPANYADAPREGIRRILEQATGRVHRPDVPLDTAQIKLIRMGTTVATNALLERRGERVALITTRGFRDLLQIGNQARPKIFDLRIEMPELLYELVVEVDERVTLVGSTASREGMNVEIPENDPSYIKGVTGEWIRVMRKPEMALVEKDLRNILAKGITSVAIAFVHAFTYPDHELAVAERARQLGFLNVSVSSIISPQIKLVSRGQSAVADAYLTPFIHRYINGFLRGFDSGISKVRVEFMKSDGGLVPAESFTGLGGLLSGPAAGVVGFAATSFDPVDNVPIIGFDMGGTSTDVSRFGGRFELVHETITAGVTIQAPQLEISTVAAGGGSRLAFRNGLFVVGPESVGADPGPVCYCKGGADLALTDANLVLGRLIPSFFPKIFGRTASESLDASSSRASFESLVDTINTALGSKMSLDEVAYGFIKVANEAMCRPIRQITVSKGYDSATHWLTSFGGAGSQHACAIASALGIRTVLIHRFSSILSAFGLSLADVVHETKEPRQEFFNVDKLEHIRGRFDKLSEECYEIFCRQGYDRSLVVNEMYLNLRYEGTDTPIMILKPVNGWDFGEAFVEHHMREFGFVLPGRNIMIDDIRIRAIAKSPSAVQISNVHDEIRSLQPHRLVGNDKVTSRESAYWQELGRILTPVYALENLSCGDELNGPALIVDSNSTIVVEPNFSALITTEHVVLRAKAAVTHAFSSNVSEAAVDNGVDPILLSVFAHRFMSIAEMMGKTLQQTAISTNIKERLDFSCAVFGSDGGLVANAPHIPVHLGSMQEAVRWQMRMLKDDIREGDVIMTNHPAAGGSHLPDITLITPLFESGKIGFFVASRGHHADIGGTQPGSMPPNSSELWEEGAAVKSFYVVRQGVFDEAGVTDILLVQPAKHEGCSGTRCLKDNISDLKAQVAANNRGIHLIQALVREYGQDVVQFYMQNIRLNAEQAVRNLLIERYDSGRKRLEAEDLMDDGSSIKLSIEISSNGSAVFDFTGTGAEVYANINAPISVTFSAIIYCLRCLVDIDIPLNQGCLEPVTIIIPNGSLLSPSEEAAVVGGNVLTSQRLCDVILRAFEACAASQGCCNNVTFGSADFGYYETIAGGSGAGPSWHGRSGVHTHMTNTRLTDPEILERRYPVVLRAFGLRRGSGGAGRFCGGDGVIREIEFLAPLTLSILSERRVFAPYGLHGGADGERGANWLVRKGHAPVNFGGKNFAVVRPGDVLLICTPGGGGYGVPSRT